MSASCLPLVLCVCDFAQGNLGSGNIGGDILSPSITGAPLGRGLHPCQIVDSLKQAHLFPPRIPLPQGIACLLTSFILGKKSFWLLILGEDPDFKALGA